jgi:peptidoglycan-associated lipoprotein
MRSALAISTLTLGLVCCLLGGCRKPAEYPACKKDQHCNGAESCIDGLCQSCQADADCGEGRSCVEFRCEAAEVSGGCACDPGLICVEGSCHPCTEASQCDSGVCSDGGRCEPPPCATDDECPIDEICDGGQCLYAPPEGEGDAGEAVCGISTLYFALDSAKLSPNNQELLAQAAACFEGLVREGSELVIEAHADDLGTDESNARLTDRRAATVREFLSVQGVPADRIRVVGKGAVEAQGTDERSRARDRRVVFIVVEQ